MFGERTKVEQDDTQIRTKDGEIYTENLGPCIAVCVAWRQWAIMTHRSEVSESEENFAEMIKDAKKALPVEIISELRPFVCGGDTEDRFNVGDPVKNRKRVLRGRARILDILTEAGFGKPHVRWNEPNETTDCYANLDENSFMFLPMVRK
jgi:hypothetical protein